MTLLYIKIVHCKLLCNLSTTNKIVTCIVVKREFNNLHWKQTLLQIVIQCAVHDTSDLYDESL